MLLMYYWKQLRHLLKILNEALKLDFKVSAIDWMLLLDVAQIGQVLLVSMFIHIFFLYSIVCFYVVINKY